MIYRFRIPTKCVAFIMVAFNLFNIVLLVYTVLTWIHLEGREKWSLAILFVALIIVYALFYSSVDLILAILLLRSTKLGEDIHACHCRAKWWKNVEICLLVFNIFFLCSIIPKAYERLIISLIVGIFHLSLIIIVWLYVCELVAGIEEGQTTLEPPLELEPEVFDMQGLYAAHRQNIEQV